MDVEFCWHMYHDELVTPVLRSIEARLEHIRTEKAKYESVGKIKLRERLLKRVRGKLPDEVIRAGDAWNKAGGGTLSLIYGECFSDYVMAKNALVKATNAYDRALKDHQAEIVTLHAEECPGCPWDGRTIFPEGGAQ